MVQLVDVLNQLLILGLNHIQHLVSLTDDAGHDNNVGPEDWLSYSLPGVGGIETAGPEDDLDHIDGDHRPGYALGDPVVQCVFHNGIKVRPIPAEP